MDDIKGIKPHFITVDGVKKGPFSTEVFFKKLRKTFENAGPQTRILLSENPRWRDAYNKKTAEEEKAEMRRLLEIGFSPDMIAEIFSKTTEEVELLLRQPAVQPELFALETKGKQE